MPVTSPSILSSISLNKRRQLVDRIVVQPDRHALVGLTGGDDAAHRRRQLADRAKRRLRRQPAAGRAR